MWGSIFSYYVCNLNLDWSFGLRISTEQNEIPNQEHVFTSNVYIHLQTGECSRRWTFNRPRHFLSRLKYSLHLDRHHAASKYYRAERDPGINLQKQQFFDPLISTINILQRTWIMQNSTKLCNNCKPFNFSRKLVFSKLIIE